MSVTPKDYWERYFSKMDPKTYDFNRYKSSSALKDFCKRYLKTGAAVLDLGCGEGRNAHYLAEQGYKVFSVDFSATAVEFCRKRFIKFNLPGTFKQGSFNKIPFPDNSFSGIICIAALDHITFDEAEISIIEIRRVLEPGGKILLTFDPPHTDEDKLNQAEILADGTLKFVRGDQKGMLFRRYKDEEIRSLLGEQTIIAFDYSETGARIIVCL